MAAAPTTTEEYVKLLTRSGLVAPEWLAEYLRKAGRLPDSATALAEQLERDGVLTPFQACQLLAGKWRGFFLGKYRILEPIARGGMGRVLLAEHTALKRRVALKVLPTNAEQDMVTLKRFQREGRAVASLDHPNIVRGYDMGHENGLVYLAMEYVEGESLAALVNRLGPLPIDLAADCIRQAALGLQHAHDAGWVHRDVKPSNLLRTPAGVVKILDLGLVRSMLETGDDLTKNYEARHILGTLDYLSPEQVRQSSAVDGRSDIYSLGATFYFLLAARPPFPGGETVAEKLLQHLIEDVEPVSKIRAEVPDAVVDVIRRMLAKDPDQRYQRPAEVVEALTGWTEGLAPEGKAPPSRMLPSLSRPAAPGRGAGGRQRWLLAARAGLALVLVVGVILGVTPWLRLDRLFSSHTDDVSVVLSPQQAIKKVGHEVTVEMTVQSVGVNTSDTVFYLNSEVSYRHRNNLAVVIPKEALSDDEADVAVLRKRYMGRRVRAVGTVTRFRVQTQIGIENLDRLRIVPAP